MAPFNGYHLINSKDLFWSPSTLMKIPKADHPARTGSQNMGARIWRIPPHSSNTLHKDIRAEESYFVLEGTGRLRISEETRNISKYDGVLIGPDQLRQVFNDTDEELLWLITGAPDELAIPHGFKPQMDSSLTYPDSPPWHIRSARKRRN